MPLFDEPPPPIEEQLLEQADPSDPVLFEGAEPGHQDASPNDDVDPWLKIPPRKRKKAPWPRKANGSPHRVSLALTCLLKFDWRYGKTKRKEPPGPEATVGKLVHGARQDAALRRIRPGRRWKNIPPIASVDELLFLLEHQPAQLLREKEEMAPITSSNLEEARRITILAGPESFKNTWAVEHPWTLRVSQGFVPGGRIDKIDHEGGSPGNPKRVTITDYKTNQLLPDPEELRFDPQPGLYMGWAKRQWPRAEIKFVLKNLRHDKSLPLYWSQEYDDFHLANARMAYNLWSSGRTEASAGDHCRYCPYREGDSGYPACPAYKKLVQQTLHLEKHPGGLKRYDVPKLMRIYRTAHVGELINKELKADTRSALLGKLGSEPTVFDYGDLRARVARDRVEAFDNVWHFLNDLADAMDVDLSALFEDVCSVNAKKVKEKVASIQDAEKRASIEELVEEYQSLGMSKPKLTVLRLAGLF